MDQSLKYELLDSLPEQVRNVSPEKLLVEYDRESDTLMLLLDFERTRGVSIRVAQDLYLRVAPDRETLLGLQLEHFITRFVRLVPESLDILDVAPDTGLSDEEIMDLRRSLAREISGERLSPLHGLMHYAHGD